MPGGQAQLLPPFDKGGRSVLQETDPRRLLAGFSAGVTRIIARAAPVFAILAEAAKTEPELAALQKKLRNERLENMGLAVRAIGRLAPLRLDESQATHTLWALTSPELFTLLAEARQWTQEQYAAWLYDCLSRLLFRDAPE